jgi:hypothetical protein
VVYAYTGLPGSGKTLSSLALLLSELKAGRHVFCNIAGLDAMMVSFALDSGGGSGFSRSYVEARLHRFSLSFSDAIAEETRVFKKIFHDGSLCYSCSQGLELLIADVMSFRETVVILDECHEYLNPENWSVLRPFAKYISMARHYGHDLVLITQHISDIWIPIQKRIHETHDFFRGQLGFRTHYKERVYYGCNVLAKPGYVRQRVDDKRLYRLYRSHEGGATERMRYMSIWDSKKFIFFIFLFFLCCGFSFYNLRRGAAFLGTLSSPPAASPPAPRYSVDENVLWVKYVVCGNFDCRAVRPDGTAVTLPLDYDSGKYPLEVRKYVQGNNYGYPSSSGGGRGAAGGGVPDARR